MYEGIWNGIIWIWNFFRRITTELTMGAFGLKELFERGVYMGGLWYRYFVAKDHNKPAELAKLARVVELNRTNKHSKQSTVERLRQLVGRNIVGRCNSTAESARESWLGNEAPSTMCVYLGPSTARVQSIRMSVARTSNKDVGSRWGYPCQEGGWHR
jgi:hypothetical protein